MLSIRVAGQYKDFVHFAGSVGNLEEVGVETAEMETPFCGKFNTNLKRKIVPSITTTLQYKDFQSFSGSLGI